MHELLFELGCEELPATFVRAAYRQLEREIVSRLDTANVPHGASKSLGTPRRLIVQVLDVAEIQPDQVKEQRGPSLKAAFDAEGKPTKALEGFCRSQAIGVDDLRREDDYVWVTKTIPGRPARELLAEILPEAVRALNFEKAMRWGSSRMRFARPIRWLLAALGGQAVAFEIESVQSGIESRGHRFNHPEPFEATRLEQLLSELRAREVEPEAEVRERRVREGAAKVASGTPILTDALVDENVFLTEWPEALEGEFPEEFLALPESVLVTAMAKHERFFPVKDSDGKLTNRFVSIRNGGVEDVVKGGNQWVLNARFNDAKFFFDEDARTKLADFLEKTRRMSFQEKLGNVRQRADRLSSLCRAVARATDANDVEASLANDAGLYAKADLSTGLVSELPSLQGAIGAEYARREGFHEAVCVALARQYDFTATPQNAPERTASRLLVADQLDKLAGYLGVGLAPSGSSDPYGLRRAATQLIEVAWNWPTAIPSYDALLRQAAEAYIDQDIPVDAVRAFELACEVFESRYRAMLSDARYDLLDAALLPGSELLDPRGVRFRLRSLELLATDVPFVQTATRPLNIVAAAERNNVAFTRENALASLDAARLDSSEGVALADALKAQTLAVDAAKREESPEALVEALRPLQGPIVAFFDTTMVMAEDADVRAARLTLLQAAKDLLLVAGDFGKVVIEG